MTEEQPIDDKTKLFNKLDKLEKDMAEVKNFINMFSEVMKAEETKPKESVVEPKAVKPKKSTLFDDLFSAYD